MARVTMGAIFGVSSAGNRHALNKKWPGSPRDGSTSPLSSPVLSTPTASVPSSSVSTCIGGSPPGMTTGGTHVSPGLGVQKHLWQKKPDGPGVQKPRRLDLVLIRGGELSNEEVVADLRAHEADKEQKRAEVEQRKKEREDKREQRKKDEEEGKKKQEQRKHAAQEKKRHEEEEKRKRQEDRAATQRRK